MLPCRLDEMGTTRASSIRVPPTTVLGQLRANYSTLKMHGNMAVRMVERTGNTSATSLSSYTKLFKEAISKHLYFPYLAGRDIIKKRDYGQYATLQHSVKLMQLPESSSPHIYRSACIQHRAALVATSWCHQSAPHVLCRYVQSSSSRKMHQPAALA